MSGSGLFYRRPPPLQRRRILTPSDVDAYDAMVLAETGLVAYLPLGLDYFDRVGGHHATPFGAVALDEPGLAVGRSARFTRSGNGYLVLAGTFALGDGPWTYEIWLRRATITGTYDNIICQNATGTPGIGITDGTGDGPINTCTSYANASGSGAQSAAYPITDTTLFHHLVVTKTSGDVWKCWVDGVDRTSNSPTASTVSNSAPVHIGIWAPTLVVPWDGWLAKAAIYAAVLPDASIQAHAAMGGAPSEGGAFPYIGGGYYN